MSSNINQSSNEPLIQPGTPNNEKSKLVEPLNKSSSTLVSKDKSVEPEEKKLKKLSWTELVVIYVSNSTLPLLCSFLTALTLFLRSTAMQLHLKETFKMLRKKGIAVTQISSSDWDHVLYYNVEE